MHTRPTCTSRSQLLSLALLAWLLPACTPAPDPAPGEAAPPRAAEPAEAPAVPAPTAASGTTFTLHDENVSDTAIKTQIEQHVVADGVPTPSELEAEIRARYRAALNRRGFTHHNPATNIYIYVYGSREQASAGEGLWIGMLGKSYGDTREPRVVINSERLGGLGAVADDRFGLSEAVRRQVFRGVAAAEDRGTREAMSRVPDTRILEQVKLEGELQQKYRAEIAKKFGLNEDQLREVSSEGVRKGWPGQ